MLLICVWYVFGMFLVCEVAEETELGPTAITTTLPLPPPLTTATTAGARGRARYMLAAWRWWVGQAASCLLIGRFLVCFWYVFGMFLVFFCYVFVIFLVCF